MNNSKNSRSYNRLVAIGQKAREKYENKQKDVGDYYIFRNPNKSTLHLPSESIDGKKEIEPNDTWKGGEEFLYLYENHLATLVKDLNENSNEDKMSNKLILDQPEEVTNEGVVEHVESEDLKEKIKNENSEDTPPVLLNEDPMEGIEILKD